MAVNKKIPMRKCVGCGEMKPKKELLRILRTETGEFVVDALGKATVEWNGRLSRQYRRKYMREWKRRWESLSKRDKVLSLIGLAMKAGKCVSGETMTESETKSGKAKFVIVAGDASENTKKKFGDMCKFYKVPFCFYGDKDTLGHAMGKEFRASLAILDEGFADGIQRELKNREDIA